MIRIDDEYYYDASKSDDLYRDTDGSPTYPLGTYLVQETKEPTGYNINDTVYYMQCVGDAAYPLGILVNNRGVKWKQKRGYWKQIKGLGLNQKKYALSLIIHPSKMMRGS